MRISASISSCLVLSASILAVPVTVADDGQIDEIVVEAFRLPTPASETGSSVWVVDEDLILQRGYQYMTDALTSVRNFFANEARFANRESARCTSERFAR